jgi:hypothetical protein
VLAKELALAAEMELYPERVSGLTAVLEREFVRAKELAEEQVL